MVKIQQKANAPNLNQISKALWRLNVFGDSPPFKSEELFARANRVVTGNLTRIKDRDTDWPIGCSESASKSGLTSGCPMCKGGPVASLKVAGSKQRGGIHTHWSRQQINSLLRFYLLLRRKTVQTACLKNPLNVALNNYKDYSRCIGGDTSNSPP